MTKKAQLVFVPSPGLGHLVSTVGFAKLILEKNDGFFITMLVIGHPFAPSLKSHIDSFASANPQIKFIIIPENVVAVPPPEAFEKDSLKTFLQFLGDHRPFVKDAIVNQVMINNPARIASVIVDLFCTCFIDVAKELGVPSNVFFTSNAAFYGFTLYLSEREDRGEPKFRETDLDYIIPYYANPVPYRVLPQVHQDSNYEGFAELGRKYKSSNGVIINTFPELESHAVNALVARDDIPPIFTVGPLIDHKGKGSSGSEAARRDEIMKWLDDQPEKSVVFLCFGSQGALREAQLKEIAVGLEHSGHRFLWAVRKPPGAGEAAPGYYSSFNEIFPEQFLERTKNIGMLCGWAPQVEVLAHKAVGAFVSHCGWNSTLEALWYGVPIITWPYYGEQHINAFQLVKDLGLALELTLDFRRESATDFVKAEDITKAVKYMIEEGSEHRNKAKVVAEEGRQALLVGGSSYVEVGRLIETWLGN